MMARTKRSRRAYSAGEWGRNRVRVFPDPKTGLYQIEWRENGRRLTRSLKHRKCASTHLFASASLTVHGWPDSRRLVPADWDQVRTLRRLSIAALSCTSSGCW